MWVSFFEVYNEQVNDLLTPAKRNLELRGDPKRGLHIDGLTREPVQQFEETMELLLRGFEEKKIAENHANQKSSRSHSVFRVSVELTDKNPVTNREIITTSEVNLVDLAGSEALFTLHDNRRHESVNINKSLHALSNVIMRLGESVGRQTAHRYINYRDSKLTRILQKALEGNSQTAIICTISQQPSNLKCSKETL
jgi:centromeric protein E